MPETLDPAEPDVASPLSRRGLIKHATVTGAAGFALSTGLVGTAAAAGSTTRAPEHPEPKNPGEPFMVRVLDVRTGELDIFHGHRHHRVRDRKLVAELLRAAR